MIKSFGKISQKQVFSYDAFKRQQREQSEKNLQESCKKLETSVISFWEAYAGMKKERIPYDQLSNYRDVEVSVQDCSFVHPMYVSMNHPEVLAKSIQYMVTAETTRKNKGGNTMFAAILNRDEQEPKERILQVKNNTDRDLLCLVNYDNDNKNVVVFKRSTKRVQLPKMTEKVHVQILGSLLESVNADMVVDPKNPGYFKDLYSRQKAERDAFQIQLDRLPAGEYGNIVANSLLCSQESLQSQNPEFIETYHANLEKSFAYLNLPRNFFMDRYLCSKRHLEEIASAVSVLTEKISEDESYAFEVIKVNRDIAPVFEVLVMDENGNRIDNHVPEYKDVYDSIKGQGRCGVTFECKYPLYRYNLNETDKEMLFNLTEQEYNLST